jgi:hypothetical protein
MRRKGFHNQDLVADRAHLGEITALVKEGVYSLDNGANVGFRADPADPHLSGLLGQLFREMNRDHEDGNLREELRDLPGNVNPVHIWHLEVEQDHIRRIFLNPL